MTTETSSEDLPTTKNAERVTALLHGLGVLDMFDSDRTTIGIGEMARHIGVHKSSASRLAATLAAAGYLEPDGSPGRYRLGGKLVALGELALADTDIQRAALPALENLVESLGETAHLAILEDGEVVTVAVVDGWHPVRMHSTVGKRSPVHSSSLGKVLLAGLSTDEFASRYPQDFIFEPHTKYTITDHDELRRELERVRADGYAVDNEELNLDVRCVAAPVFNRKGRVAAALGISGPSTRIDRSTMPQVAEVVREAAHEVGTRLGAPPSAGFTSTLAS